MNIAEAQAAYDNIKAKLDAAQDAVSQLKHALDMAIIGLREARISADSALPKATVITKSWYSDFKESREVVIVKRTPKQITVRTPGGCDVTTFRYDGDRWCLYPSPKFGGVSTTLELQDK